MNDSLEKLSIGWEYDISKNSATKRLIKNRPLLKERNLYLMLENMAKSLLCVKANNDTKGELQILIERC